MMEHQVAASSEVATDQDMHTGLMKDNMGFDLAKTCLPWQALAQNMVNKLCPVSQQNEVTENQVKELTSGFQDLAKTSKSGSVIFAGAAQVLEQKLLSESQAKLLRPLLDSFETHLVNAELMQAELQTALKLKKLPQGWTATGLQTAIAAAVTLTETIAMMTKQLRIMLPAKKE